MALMTVKERILALKVEYYRSMYSRWCWLERKFHTDRANMQRLVCLLEQERQEGVPGTAVLESQLLRSEWDE